MARQLTQTNQNENFIQIKQLRNLRLAFLKLRDSLLTLFCLTTCEAISLEPVSKPLYTNGSKPKRVQ